jgi:hypothetical protein
MRKSLHDFKKNAGMTFKWSDLVISPSEFSLITLVTDLEQAFLSNSWDGSKFLVVSGDAATVFHDPTPVRTPANIQQTASRFREVSQELAVKAFACIINLDATPDLPGALGPLFGFQALVSVLGEEMRVRPYDTSSGGIEFRGTLDSAMKTNWEYSLGEPLEKFLHRLFIPILG